jgi:pSer/pThr/pTyr-binding forkhead associated (FHA) protein
MKSPANSRSAGRDPSCDLVLDDPQVSQVHANLELAENGLISVTDNDSRNGMFLNRSDNWIRVRKITLCIGDRVRLGELEIPLQRLTTVFGQDTNAKLEARHFALIDSNNSSGAFTNLSGSAPVLNKPVRNPVTGKIEEQE